MTGKHFPWEETIFRRAFKVGRPLVWASLVVDKRPLVWACISGKPVPESGNSTPMFLLPSPVSSRLELLRYEKHKSTLNWRT